MEKKALAAIDWIVIGAYFVMCLSIGVFSKLKHTKNTVEEYFLAGRSMVWLAVGCSLYASNMGSEHFIGLAGSGASTGIAVVAYEWHASWILLLLGFFFVPIYIRSEIYTMPEYLKCRFRSKWIRIYLTVVCLISYVMTKVAVDLYAGSLFIEEAVGFNIYLSSLVLLVFTATYTLLGGLSAVIYTDFIQCIIMICGSLALTLIGFNKIGGLAGLWEKYPYAVGKSITATTNIINTTEVFSPTIMSVLQNTTTAMNSSACYAVDDNWNHIFRPVSDGNFPWIGVVFSLPITGIWYWCTDQVIVQRTLGAKNLVHARAGTVLAGFLKILPLFTMIMPGMVARVLFPDTVACPDAASCYAQCGNELGCSNLAFPQLVLKILPRGLVGLMLSVMVAAVMSSLSSAFNSASTIFTIDIWKVLRPKARDRELLWVGRIVVVALVGVGIAWVPVVQSGGKGELFTYLQSIQAYLAPPTCAVFLIGMLTPKLTEKGALSSMLFGLALGLVRLALDIIYTPPKCGELDTRPFFVKLHFMYYSLVLFFISIILMCVVSAFTCPVPRDMLGRLTWQTMNIQKYIEPVYDGDDHTVLADVPINMAEEFKTRYDNQEPNVREVQFESTSMLQKWSVKLAASALVVVLIALWVYFR